MRRSFLAAAGAAAMSVALAMTGTALAKGPRVRVPGRFSAWRVPGRFLVPGAAVARATADILRLGIDHIGCDKAGSDKPSRDHHGDERREQPVLDHVLLLLSTARSPCAMET